ncbi:phage tail spike protein [Streptococcus acidominimus]|uniref:Tail spike domain-containing protein n=1 Tax=Streptococcus acidominimus TaxID=1326 RepID=A0A4Y9FQ80_STRAI|nr:phage tail spike protein [Streptococcus acidominimus]MBF0847231.1 phage tail protein [Streptococcus danieliae]MBF0818317.1 phage tail protein [Streptococcus acidominimus]MBF0838838.1 phage tail protein [Streptococcus acidominimus]MBF0839530.1 phage tail protein [Streptococcus acidominimus]TFU31385.1 hypothetical protein E4U01_02435 [Streptococcus acidominimus]
MIYLKESNIPLNLAWDDNIVQEANGTYQLSFKFPVTDESWSLLTPETFLLADDLHGEQEFFIFDVVKENGYVQVYANQVATLLNYYTMSTLNVDRVAGQTVMNALAGSIVRKHPFSFSSDIMAHHSLNIADKSVMEVLVKDRHSILGQWGGDLVRDKYAIKLLQNGGTENESLFMYRKNLSKYHASKSVKDLRTRIHFKKTLTSQEGGADRTLSVTVDSPLIEKYSQIYEATLEVSDQDVKDVASLKEYGKRYFASTLCDLVEESLELEVKGKSDVPVKIFDTVSVYHERFDTDIRVRISKYHFSPMSKKLKSIGFGKVSQSIGGQLSGMVSDAVSDTASTLLSDFEVRLQKEIENANRSFETAFEKQKATLEDGIEQAKAEAEQSRATLATQIESKLAEQRAEAQRDKTALSQRLTASKEELEALIGDVERNMQSGISESYQSLSQALTAYETLVGEASQNALQAQTLANTLAGQQNTLSQQLLRQREDNEGWRNSFEATISAELGVYRNELAQVRGKFDDAGNLTALETYKRTQEESTRGIRTQLEALAQDTARISRIETQADKVVQTVESLNSDVLKKSEFLIEDGRIQVSADKVIDGNTLASLLTVQPDAIRTVTNKMVITSHQTNLVGEKYKNVCVRISTGGAVMDAPLAINEKEFLITGEAMRVSGSGPLYFYCRLTYTDGKTGWLGYTTHLTNTTKTPFKLTSKLLLPAGKTVSNIIFCVSMQASNEWELCNLSIVPKTSAELIVDGSITADKLNVNSVRAGILTANSITSNMLQANAITADKLKVDTAMINKLASNDALINSLVAKRAFITAVQAVDLSATRIKSGVLQSQNGNLTFDLNNSNISFKNNSASIKRLASGYATQFIKLETGQKLTHGQGGALASRMTLGMNHQGSEDKGHAAFTGLVIWNGKAKNSGTADLIELISDRMTWYNQGATALIFDGQDINETRIYPEKNSTEGVCIFGLPNRRFSKIYVNEMHSKETYVTGSNGQEYRIKQMLKDLALKIGYKGVGNWADYIG